jgi:hypothetical protein
MIPMLVVVLLLALVGAAAAQPAGPVNPSTVTFVAPTTNANGTPLTDLAGYYLRVTAPLASGTCPPFTTATYAFKKSVGTTSAAPPANTTVMFGTPGSGNLAGDLGLTADGQYCILATAVDTGMSEGGASNILPFVVNKTPPSAPSVLRVNP